MNTVVENSFLSLFAEPRFITDRRGVQAQVVVKEWHRVACTEWHPKGEPIGSLVCAHGFSRNRYDLDMLAQALSVDGWRIIHGCPLLPCLGPIRSNAAPSPQ